MVNIDYELVHPVWNGVKEEISKVIVGQDKFVDRLLMAIAVQGHVLVEGLPGLAKTLTVNLLGKILQTSVSRIQFTPDLLPSDVTGTMIFNQKDGDFKQHKGPIFSNFVIADEINRAPAKVQAALLQAMEERCVTLGNSVLNLPKPFVVMATQNPIEQEGTFELPEAQLDRFLFKLELKYPSRQDEFEILNRIDNLSIDNVEAKFQLEKISKIGEISRGVFVDDSMKKYIVQLVASTRGEYAGIGMLDKYIEYGASPRASLAILKCGRIQALLNNRDYVTPDDIKAIVLDILRHRIILSFEAIGSGINANSVIKNILDNVNIPK